MCDVSWERRRAGALAGSSAALTSSWMTSWRHGHPALGWLLLGLQLGMVCTAIVLLYQVRRRGCVTSVRRDC
jgi:hypothetical protein